MFFLPFMVMSYAPAERRFGLYPLPTSGSLVFRLRCACQDPTDKSSASKKPGMVKGEIVCLPQAHLRATLEAPGCDCERGFT